MNWRTVAGASGVVVLVAALTSVALPTGALVGLAGNDYFLVAAFGVLACLAGLSRLVAGRASTMDQAAMPEPERPPSVPTAGDGFDDRTGSLRFVLPVVGAADREAVRERVRSAAVATIRRTERCDRETARERVERGAWTDDRDAAAFLDGASRGPGDVFLARRRARAAADAVAHLEEGSR